MLLRRFGQNRRNLGLATLGIAFIVCVYLYYDLLSQLKQNDERNERLKVLQNSLSTQLQVVYEHKSRLERSIQDEKDSHHRTKEAKQELEMKLNREKQELQSRFQTLNQKQRILQSQFEDLQKELSKSEADYQLLKADHQREIEEYKEKILLQNKQCDNERKYLQAEIADLRQLKTGFSQNLAQCQEALRSYEVRASELNQNKLPQQSIKEGPRLNQSLKSIRHIDQNPVASPKMVDNALPNPDEVVKEEVGLNLKHQKDVAQPVAPFFRENTNLTYVKHSNINRTGKLSDINEVQLQAVPPPEPVLGKREPKIDNEDAGDLGHLAWKRERAVGADPLNAAVIEAPDGIEHKQDFDKKLNEDEEQEDAGVKNEQNEADQKEEDDGDDYHYDKNAGDEEKNDEKADDFPDAVVANKNVNKIQNPVYPDDVEVLNH